MRRIATTFAVLGLVNVSAAQVKLPVISIKAKLTADAASVREAAADTSVRVAHNPGRFSASGMTVHGLLSSILGVPGHLIVGGPDWVKTTGYNIEATALGVPQSDIGDVALSVLEQRFALQLRREVRRVPIYALTRIREDGTLGPRIRQVVDCTSDPNETSLGFGRTVIKCRPWLPGYVTRGLDRPVEDRTGITGLVDLQLEWSPELTLSPAALPSSDPAAVSLFTALQEQLGLRLQPDTGPVEVLVIDSIERPTPN
jgi:uncharacterized protein (TIGR03435 family)